MPSGSYAATAKLVDNWLALNRSPGFSFEPEGIFKFYSKDITTKEQKNDVMEKLWYEVNKRHNLEKIGRLYKTINRNIEYLDDWDSASLDEIVPLSWPVSHLDNSEFDFARALKVPTGGLIVVAGVSNAGKTAFMQNLLAENCHKFPCIYWNSEPNKSMFRRRLGQMEWFNPYNGDGNKVFHHAKNPGNAELKYAVAEHADKINLIDWVMWAEDKFWQIDLLMESLKAQMRGGVVVVALQKEGTKTLGTGGQFSEHHADIYITLDFNLLTVRKAKEHDHTLPDPNHKTYGFDLDRGVDFFNIREVKPCPKCRGNCAKNHSECDTCHSKGFVDKNAPEY